jgi:hypothetical protein
MPQLFLSTHLPAFRVALLTGVLCLSNALAMAQDTTALREVAADRYLRAPADFYGSKSGASAMLKFGTCTAQIMPAIQAEVQRGIQEIRANQSKK